MSRIAGPEPREVAGGAGQREREHAESPRAICPDSRRDRGESAATAIAIRRSADHQPVVARERRLDRAPRCPAT